MSHYQTVPEALRKADKESKLLLSIEIIPPRKGHDVKLLFNSLDALIDFKPCFINVTNHPAQSVVVRHQGRAMRKTISKRPGTVGICAAIMQRYLDTTPVAHVICMGESKNRIEDNLIDLNYLGLRNLLVLRGDKPANNRPAGTPEMAMTAIGEQVFTHSHASGLVKQIENLNNGIYLDSSVKEQMPTNFSIGVAGYPEKHSEASSFDEDISYLKRKIELGAEYIVTQMFFDNSKYYNFVNRCRRADITVPIIPGLKLISSFRHIDLLPKLFHLTFPSLLASRLDLCSSEAAIAELGVAWCIEQCIDLKCHNVPMLHFYTMNNDFHIKRVLSRIF